MRFQRSKRIDPTSGGGEQLHIQALPPQGGDKALGGHILPGPSGHLERLRDALLGSPACHGTRDVLARPGDSKHHLELAPQPASSGQFLSMQPASRRSHLSAFWKWPETLSAFHQYDANPPSVYVQCSLASQTGTPMHRPSGFARFQSPAPDCDPPDWILTLGTVGARRLAGIVPGMKLGDVPWEGEMGRPWLELVSEALATGREVRIARSPVSAATWHALELHSPDSGCLDLIFCPAGESVEQERLLENLRAHERMLLGEKKLLAVTLRSIGDAVITTDRDGLVTMLNKVAEDLTGWSLEDAIGRKLATVFVIVEELSLIHI